MNICALNNLFSSCIAYSCRVFLGRGRRAQDRRIVISDGINCQNMKLFVVQASP